MLYILPGQILRKQNRATTHGNPNYALAREKTKHKFGVEIATIAVCNLICDYKTVIM